MFLPLVFLAGKLLAGAAAAAIAVVAIVFIYFDDVMRKLRQHKRHDKEIGRLIKEHLDNGKVKIVASVLSKHPLGIFPRHVQHEETFEGRLDERLEALFQGKEKVKVSL